MSQTNPSTKQSRAGPRRASSGAVLPTKGLTIPFRAIAEDEPGPAWAEAFAGYWPAYKAWYLHEGITARPTYLQCRRAIRAHMPELAPIWEACCELAGGGDLAARFLSMYGPPAYVAGCSQAVWHGESPVLVRNYDYYPAAFDAVVLQTGWGGRRVIGLADGMIGLLDGINEGGLAVSLTFGGRRSSGRGFGVPIILRYLLQTCSTVADATERLMSLPCHMAYNVTLLDAKGRWATVYLNPDREAVVTNASVATNHQQEIEWHQHARATASVERERFLLKKLSLHKASRTDLVSAFLRPPLYSLAFDRGYGTLYTTVYEPKTRTMEMRWPGQSWSFDIEQPHTGTRAIQYPVPVPAAAAR